jgi:cytochrome b subunit of formate dehydrogenase
LVFLVTTSIIAKFKLAGSSHQIPWQKIFSGASLGTFLLIFLGIMAFLFLYALTGIIIKNEKDIDFISLQISIFLFIVSASSVMVAFFLAFSASCFLATARFCQNISTKYFIL